MMSLKNLRRPGEAWSPQLPRRFQKLLRQHALSPLHVYEMARRTELRKSICRQAGLSDAELQSIVDSLASEVRPHQASLEAAPVLLPPLGGLLQPPKQSKALATQPIRNWWQQGHHVLPRECNHIDKFRKKPVIAQLGPDCVGHACRNAAEVYQNELKAKYSGLFAWDFAMEQAGYPIPPQGTWPDVVLKGMARRGVCLEKHFPEKLYHDDRYAKPSSEAYADAKKHKIDTSINLRSLIGDPATIELMCLLLHGVPELNLPGRALILGVGLPEEWLLTESLVSGVRPLPLSDEPQAGHSFVLVGYFFHQNRLWFIGLENWGPRIGSTNPFGYPRDLGLVFIPGDFFRDPKWFWDLAIAVTHKEARLFNGAAGANKQKTAVAGKHFHRTRKVLIGTAIILSVLRLMFPGNWW